MAQQLLDTNVLLRHFLQDHPSQSPRATAYLHRIERGEVQVRLSEIVIFETVFTLQRQYRQPRDKIRDAVLDILGLRGIILPGKRRLQRVFDLYVNLNLSFADAYHVLMMQQLKISGALTFDRGLDRVPEIKRREP